MSANVDKPISQLLPERFFTAREKEGVIRYLAAADLPAAVRRRYFRRWCNAVFLKARPEDLARVAPGKPKERQAPLFQ